MKHIFSKVILFTLLITSFVLAQSAEMDNEAKKIYNEGNKLRKAGDFRGAIAKYDEVLKTTNDYRVYYQKGVTLKNLGRIDEAEKALSKCLEQKKDFPAVYNALGSLEFKRGNYLKAIEYFEEFSKIVNKPKLKNRSDQYIAQSYTKLALKEKADGKHQKAAEYLLKATSKAQYDKAYLALAEVYVDMGKFDDALVAADKALNYRKTITNGGPYYYKGMAFKGKGDKAKAKESFKKGLKDKNYGKLCKYELDSL